MINSADCFKRVTGPTRDCNLHFTVAGRTLLALVFGLVLSLGHLTEAYATCSHIIEFASKAKGAVAVLDVSGCSDAVRHGLYVVSGTSLKNMPVGKVDVIRSAQVAMSDGTLLSIDPQTKYPSSSSAPTDIFDKYDVKLEGNAKADTMTFTLYYDSDPRIKRTYRKGRRWYVSGVSPPSAVANTALTIQVNVASGRITTTPTRLPDAILGQSYSVDLSTYGGINGGAKPYKFITTPASGKLPPGLSLAENGTLGGTPTANGRYSFTVKVTDSSSPRVTITSKTLTLVVRPYADPGQDANVRGIVTAQNRMAQQFARAQIDNVSQHLESLHGGSLHDTFGASLELPPIRRADLPDEIGSNEAGPNETEQGVAGGVRDTDRQSRPASSDTATNRPGRRFALWTAGSLSLLGNKDDIDIHSDGLSAGIDYQIAPRAIVGVGLGVGYAHADIGGDGSRTRGRSADGVVYGTLQTGKNGFVDVLAGYDALSFDSRRVIAGGSASGGAGRSGMATGSRDGAQVFGQISAGMEYRTAQWMLSPYMRLRAISGHLDAFGEDAADPTSAVHFDRQGFRSTRIDLGLRGSITRKVSFGDLFGTVTPNFRMEYHHFFKRDIAAGVYYADLTDRQKQLCRLSGGCVVTLPGAGENQLTLGLGVDVAIDGGTRMKLGYRTTSGDGAHSRSLGLGVDARFGRRTRISLRYDNTFSNGAHRHRRHRRGPVLAGRGLSVHVFGDSLSDGGNRGPYVYDNDKNKIWAQLFAAHFGVGLKPSETQHGSQPSTDCGFDFDSLAARSDGTRACGTDYATGSAEAIHDDKSGKDDTYPTSKQVATYLARAGGHADRKGVYIHYVGGDDLIALLNHYRLQITSGGTIQETEIDDISKRASSTVKQVDSLLKADAGLVVVPTVADISQTPGILYQIAKTARLDADAMRTLMDLLRKTDIDPDTGIDEVIEMIEKAEAINCSPKAPSDRFVCNQQFNLIKSMFKRFSARATQYSKYWNDFVDDGLTATGGNIMRVDFHKLFKEIAKDPNRYGFSKKLLAVSCPLGDKGEAVHAQHCHSKDGKGFKSKDDDGYAYAFSDPLHPSPEMQSIMNDYTVSVYDAPIQVLSLGSELAGFSQDSSSTLDSRFEQFHVGKHRLHGFSLFLGSDNHVKDLENDTEMVSHDALTIGEDYQFSDNAMIGVLFSHSIGYQRPFANFHYSAKGIALSAFGALDLFDHGYVNADIAYARMSFSNINRDIKLGAAVRTETSAAGRNSAPFRVGRTNPR